MTPTYKLTVTKTVPNPHYKPAPRASSYGYDDRLPEECNPHTEARTLEVSLTEEEWHAVKRETMRYFDENVKGDAR